MALFRRGFFFWVKGPDIVSSDHTQMVLTLGDGLTSWSEDGLDLIGVDESGDIRRSDLGDGEGEARLVLVDVVEGSNGRLGPDDESTDVTSWGELEQVELVNWAGLDTWDVLEGSNDTLILGVDDEGSSSLPVSPVPHLSLSSSDLSGVGNFGDVGVGGNGFEELDGGLGLVDRLDGRGEDEGNFLDLLDSVSSGKNQRWEGRSGNGGSDGVSLLVLVDLYVPSSPGLGWGEHSTTSAHVTEGSLSRSLCTTTRHTGDTGNSSSSTPRLGRGLVTSVLGDGVWLSLVLGHGLCKRLQQTLLIFLSPPATHCGPAEQHPIGWER